MFIIYSFFSVVVFIFSCWAFNKLSGGLAFSKPNMISYIFYYNVIAQSFVGAVLIIYGFAEEHYMIGVTTSSAKYHTWVFVLYVMISMPVGMWLSKSLWFNKVRMSDALNTYTSKPINTSSYGGGALKISVFIFSCISLLSCLYTFYMIGYIPIRMLFTSEFWYLSLMRINSSREFGGNAIIRNVFALILAPMMSYAWYAYFNKTKKMTDFIIYMVMFIASINILIYDFSKSPVLWYVIGMVFLRFYISGKLNVSRLVPVIIFVISVVVFFYTLSGFGVTFSYISGPIGRILLGQISGLPMMLDIFPNVHDHIGFASMSQALSELLGHGYVERSARIAMEYFNPRGVAEGTAGVMNTLFIGEAWANFGIVGVFISPIWVGFLIQTLYILFLRFDKNPLTLAFFAYSSVSGAVTGGFNDYVYGASFLIVMMLILSILFIGQTIKKI
ncbi:polymerase [Pectobacterium carotovorum subsp. carotovorum]|nr:polymerase [Pectobacterium carotovorum subsp. carotovorum]